MASWGRSLLVTVLAIGMMLPTAAREAEAAGSAGAGGNGGAGSNGKVGIMLDGYPLPFPVEPVLENGTTLVPFRTISEALGVRVVWDPVRQTITATRMEPDGGTKTIVLKPGSKTATVNGKREALSAAPRTTKGSTLIPLSFFSRQYGAQVRWVAETRTVEIRSPREPVYGLAFYALSSYDELPYLPKFGAAAFGWSRLDDEGRFTTEGAEYRWPKPAGDVTPESIVADASANGTKPYLMLYSGDVKLQLTAMLADDAKQNAVIDGLIGTARDKGFEGVLLDLEGLGLTGDKKAVRAAYNAFVGRVSERAKEAGLKLAVAVHPLNGPFQGYDYGKLGELADELIIMAYAYGDEKSPEPNDKVDEAIRLALEETDKEKLVLGISLASEDERSVNVKIGLAKRYGLKGIAVWRLGLIGEAAMTAMEKTADLRG